MVNIEGLPHPTVLAGLYNKSRAVGIGKYQYNPNHNMTYREAENLLKSSTSFNMLYGRVMYFDIEPDSIEIDNTLYDKYLGEDGRMQRIIDDIRKHRNIK